MQNQLIKFSLVLLLLILCSFAAGLYFPWWSMSLVCFTMAIIIRMKPWQYLLAGFLSVFILWGGMAYWISVKNNYILTHRISKLILNEDKPIHLIILTALMGGIVAGLSCWSGSWIRKLWHDVFSIK